MVAYCFDALTLLSDAHRYALYDRLPKRIIETAAYHQLSTTAAVRLCGSMFGLMEWMMAAKVPVSAIAYYGGGDQVPNPEQRGFANVWRRYQAETREQVPDLSQLTLQDVSGAFDANEFMQQIKARPQQVGSGHTPPPSLPSCLRMLALRIETTSVLNLHHPLSFKSDVRVLLES
jgi:hypothetical protein